MIEQKNNQIAFKFKKPSNLSICIVRKIKKLTNITLWTGNEPTTLSTLAKNLRT